ncbi:MAG TPA: cytidine deaminase [Pirellulales bacterium]|nr:cytidine deaminase [Pirellulales bacterium]
MAERVTASGTSPFTLDNDATRRRLIDAAIVARQRAYAPYSRFRVGAALLTASNRIYDGSNVENASYGLTICAERVAFSTAVAAGETNFLMLAVASDVGATPCGACRQFAAEFCADLPILLVDVRNASQPVEMHLAELLPGGFKLPRQVTSHRADSADRS